MARVTVEDCVVKIPNRFELVALSAQRAKDIASGSPITVNRDNDKDTVVSLREIAKENLTVQQLRDGLLQSFMQRSSLADPEVSFKNLNTNLADEEDIRLAAAALESELQGAGMSESGAEEELSDEDELDEDEDGLSEDEADFSEAAFDDENIDAED